MATNQTPFSPIHTTQSYTTIMATNLPLLLLQERSKLASHQTLQFLLEFPRQVCHKQTNEQSSYSASLAPEKLKYFKRSSSPSSKMKWLRTMMVSLMFPIQYVHEEENGK